MGALSGASQVLNVPGVTGQNTAGGEGVRGEGNGAAAVAGYNTSTQAGHGVSGEASKSGGEGVHGTSHTGYAGVGGYNDSPNGGPGVWGEASKNGGEGVHGISHTGYAAVGGYNDSPSGGPGVWGEASKNGGEGVHGTSHTGYAAVGGYNDSPSGGPGVWGEASKNGGEGVHGMSHTGFAGVGGYNDSPNGGPGVWGESQHGPAGVFKGSVVVTGDIQLTGGADCSERFEVSGAESCAPGTVMMIDDTGTLIPSRGEYDTRVAGVVSGAGNLRPGLILGEQTPAPGQLPIALAGTVFCMATADSAPITVGDLLTTSAVPGCAMKASEPARAFGAIIGKALQPLASGVGLIRILIALQ